jgi:hypothetical protein
MKAQGTRHKKDSSRKAHEASTRFKKRSRKKIQGIKRAEIQISFDKWNCYNLQSQKMIELRAG